MWSMSLRSRTSSSELRGDALGDYVLLAFVQAEYVDGDMLIALADACPYGRVARLETVHQVLRGEARYIGIDLKSDAERLVTDDVFYHLGLQSEDSLERREDRQAPLLHFG